MLYKIYAANLIRAIFGKPEMVIFFPDIPMKFFIFPA